MASKKANHKKHKKAAPELNKDMSHQPKQHQAASLQTAAEPEQSKSAEAHPGQKTDSTAKSATAVRQVPISPAAAPNTEGLAQPQIETTTMPSSQADSSEQPMPPDLPQEQKNGSAALTFSKDSVEERQADSSAFQETEAQSKSAPANDSGIPPKLKKKNKSPQKEESADLQMLKTVSVCHKGSYSETEQQTQTESKSGADSASPSKPKHKPKRLTPAEQARLETYCALELLDYPKALKQAKKACQLCPDDAYSEALLALALRGNGKYHEAAVHAANAAAADPNSCEYKFIQGLCEWYVQDETSALQTMKDAMRGLPKRLDLRTDYAGFLLKQRRFQDAVEQTNRVLAAAPQCAKAAIISKCASERSYNKCLDLLISTPPLPPQETDSCTFTAIAGAYLNSDYFDMALKQCSNALDNDLQNEEAKSIYATAYFLKQHHVTAFFHRIRGITRNKANRIIFLFLPVLILIGFSAWHYKQNHLPNSIVCAVLLSVYLAAYFIIWKIGSIRISGRNFTDIVNTQRLTPQGRIPKDLPSRNALDEVIAAGAKDSAAAYADLKDAVKQLKQTCKRLDAIAATFFTFACLAMVCLLIAIIIQSNSEQLGDSIFPITQRILGIVIIICSAFSYNNRHRSSELKQRIGDMLPLASMPKT